MKFNNTKTYNMDGAFRGMRNPLQSWERSDSTFYPTVVIGPKDMELAKKLIKGGSEHRKFLRQIIVSVDITAPLYWWKEFDTYKVGTVANSTSTMHTIAKKEITIEDFELDDMQKSLEEDNFLHVIQMCNDYRKNYLMNKDTDPIRAKLYWKALIRLLPEGYLQTRTVTMSYENVRSIIHQRKGHKLAEWSDSTLPSSFINWARTLPYSMELIFE